MQSPVEGSLDPLHVLLPGPGLPSCCSPGGPPHGNPALCVLSLCMKIVAGVLARLPCVSQQSCNLSACGHGVLVDAPGERSAQAGQPAQGMPSLDQAQAEGCALRMLRP